MKRGGFLKRKTGFKRKAAKKTKKPKTPLEKAKEALMDIAKKYIKLRDGPTCWTCGKKGLSGKDFQGGHFIRDSVGGVLLRYDEHNIHPQCMHCNIFKGGNEGEYTMKMIKEYGIEFVEELYRIKNQEKTKWNLQNYLDKIEYYKQKISELKNG